MGIQVFYCYKWDFSNRLILLWSWKCFCVYWTSQLMLCSGHSEMEVLCLSDQITCSFRGQVLESIFVTLGSSRVIFLLFFFKLNYFYYHHCNHYYCDFLKIGRLYWMIFLLGCKHSVDVILCLFFSQPVKSNLTYNTISDFR